MESIWIVQDCQPYEGCYVVAVFSTEQQAKAYIETQKHPYDLSCSEWKVK